MKDNLNKWCFIEVVSPHQNGYSLPTDPVSKSWGSKRLLMKQHFFYEDCFHLAILFFLLAKVDTL